MDRKRCVAAGLLLLGFVLVVPSSAQERAEDPLAAARDQVTAELAAMLPDHLPDGALAVLPPEVTNREAVDGDVSRMWATALGGAIHSARPKLRQADRAHLEDVLREQKLGDSPYADPATAARIGKLVAARVLLLTQIHEFRLDNGAVRVSLEANLVDTETGENLWSTAYTKGIFPFWVRVVLVCLLVAILMGVAWIGVRTWRSRLVRRKLPRTKEEARVDVNGLAHSVPALRERLQREGASEGASAVHDAWQELDPILDRVRHALPGGSVDRSRVRDLAAARRSARSIQGIVAEMRRECDLATASDEGGRRVAGLLRAESASLREALDEYRRHLA